MQQVTAAVASQLIDELISAHHPKVMKVRSCCFVM